MNRKLAMVTCGLVLGLGWALRGHFGHEWGASWAGMLLSLAILALGNRPDWTSRMPVLAALGTLGWSVGGIMSYGIIVGYGRGDGFPNVYYGLVMLAVVGFLWGATGGGFLGLGLETSRGHRPDWISLLTRMVACALIFHGALIKVLDLKMTPPRSEAWAGCLGAVVALVHYLYREGYFRALRVALWSGLGSGFGFALGNFFQTAGGASGIGFNWWNVMEFTLGFCGGLAAAWAVFSTDWPRNAPSSSIGGWVALIFILPGIPAINLMMTFKQAKFIELAEKAGFPDPGGYARLQPILGGLVVILLGIAGLLLWKRVQKPFLMNHGSVVFIFLCLQMFGYMLLSHLLKGVFWGFGGLQLEQYLYWPIALTVVVFWIVFLRGEEPFWGRSSLEPFSVWFMAVIVILVAAAVLALVSISLHDGLSGVQYRF